MTDMAISKMETTTQKGRERMTAKELNDVLGKHKKWMNDEEGGRVERMEEERWQRR